MLSGPFLKSFKTTGRKDSFSVNCIIKAVFKVRDQSLTYHGYHILYHFRTSTPVKGKCSCHFKDLHKMELMTNCNVNLTPFRGGVMNSRFIT